MASESDLLKRRIVLPLLAGLLAATAPAHAFDGESFALPVTVLEQAPTLDGDDADWLAQGATWIAMPPTEASYVDDPEDKDASESFRPQPEIMAGLHGDRLYFAIRWQDDRADTIYRRWVPRGGKYRRDRKRDDMLALRFHTAGSFSDCMISGRDYTADVWRWSAGRSQLAGMADDLLHVFSLKPLDRAAEYDTEHGTLYIKKTMDQGKSGWRIAPRPAKGGSQPMIGVLVEEDRKQGSRADVAAFGDWRDGKWTLELARKLDTGDADDVRFEPGSSVAGQLAFFNPGYRMQKQISKVLMLQIPNR